MKTDDLQKVMKEAIEKIEKRELYINATDAESDFIEKLHHVVGWLRGQGRHADAMRVEYSSWCVLPGTLIIHPKMKVRVQKLIAEFDSKFKLD